MNFWNLVKSDLFRYNGKTDIKTLIYSLLFNRGFKYTFYLRGTLCIQTIGINHLMFFMLNHYGEKYLIDLSCKASIGRGLYIGHAMGIVVSPGAVIGNNCNISQFVTIGRKNRGKYEGYPTIGDNVYIGPGAKIIGRVHVGSNTAIGANCVVTKDIPDNSVVVGVPGRIISYEGSNSYVNHIAPPFEFF
jgi:serine O-acetyltransferase